MSPHSGSISISILDIPDEVMRSILVRAFDGTSSVALSCTTFKNAMRSSYSSVSIALGPGDMLGSSLHHMVNLRRLELRSESHKVAEVAEVAEVAQSLTAELTAGLTAGLTANLTRLEVLRLNNLRLDSSVLAEVARLPALSELCLDDCFLTDSLGSLRDAADPGPDIGADLKLKVIQVKSSFDVTPLARLTSLTHLDLSRARVKDLRPLSAMKSLKYLNCRGSYTHSIDTLAALTALTYLDLEYGMWRTPATADLAPIVGLTSLVHLNMGGTCVSDLAPLAASLTRLTYLDIADTDVSDVEPLSALPALSSLDISYTRVEDVTPLLKLTSLTCLKAMEEQVAEGQHLSTLTSLTSLWARCNLYAF